jgi:hypothetical protein
MNFGEVIEIQDLGNHPALMVINLGILLAGEVNVTPDPKRKGFYEFEADSIVYYLHLSPVTGTIFFLATWERTSASSAPPQVNCFLGLLSAKRYRSDGKGEGLPDRGVLVATKR